MTNDIILIGPISPYRGGIAQYNTALFRALASQGLTETGYSFSRQYPHWLYPGDTDTEPDDSDHVEPGIKYSIDSVNPITWYRTAKSIIALDPKAVVFHWWTVFWLPCFIAISWLVKRRGIRVVLICHNLTDHDAQGVKARTAEYMLSKADGFLVHSSEHARFLQSIYSSRSVAQHPIPAYEWYPRPKGLLQKRGRLELLFFGFIRPYKGLDCLIEALRSLGDSAVYLTVVGEPWGEAMQTLQFLRESVNIELHLEYAPMDEVAEFFARADLVVLPYRRATGSAVVAVAFHYETPVLATRVGGLPDVVIDGETGILVTPGDVDVLRQAISTATRAESARLSTGVRRFKKRHSWQSLAKTLAQLALEN